MIIEVLGTGCAKCKAFEKITREVVEQNGIDAGTRKVEDIIEIMIMYAKSSPEKLKAELKKVIGPLL